MHGSIHGYVVRGDTQRPAASATVTIVRATGSAPDISREPDAGPETDSAGWFAFSALEEGDWIVRAVGPHGGRGEARLSVFDNAVTEVTIALNGLHRWMATALGSANREKAPMTGSVRGRVLRAKGGAPVADATVGVLRGAGPAPDIAPLTDALGHFALDGLPPGTWVLAATAPDGAHGTAEFSIHGNQETHIEIEVR